MQKSGVPSETAVAPAPRGRGRPRAFDRVAALDQAMRLFWRNGYEGTSISDLTAAMGIGAPSLYAAFGSKEALYLEAIGHYGATHDGLVWDGFRAAPTARAAIRTYLRDSAAALTEPAADLPTGCMVTLSSAGASGCAAVEAQLRSARAITQQRLEARLALAVSDGELPDGRDLAGLVRFVQTLQAGMSILARDGVDRADLEAAADIAMLGWDAAVQASLQR